MFLAGMSLDGDRRFGRCLASRGGPFGFVEGEVGLFRRGGGGLLRRGTAILVGDRGVGTALIKAVIAAARAAGCRRLWLITTNDNLRALGFYQKRGFALVAVHRNALDRSREMKPQIGFIGENGIPLRGKIELEYLWPGDPGKA